jgi:hypothetical protein
MVSIKKSPNEGDNMRQFARKTLVATSIALIMTSGATAAMADDSSSSSPTSTIPRTSTTIPSSSPTSSVPRNNDGPRLTPAQRAAYLSALQTYRTELTNYYTSKVAIEKAFWDAVRDANSTRIAARETAVTAQEKKAVHTAFNTSMSDARAARTSALPALGTPPVKPVKAG